MRLECSQCVVRDWSPSDKAALVHAANNRNVWRNLTDMFRIPTPRPTRMPGSLALPA